MSENLARPTYRFGDSLHNAKQRNNTTATANRDRERQLAGDTDYTGDELKAEQERLKARMYARNPEYAS